MSQPIYKADAADLIEDLMAELEPEMSFGEALAKHWRDADVQCAYELHQASPDDPEPAAPVRKAADGGAAWQQIEALAKAAVLEAGATITKAEAVDRILVARPDLYRDYLLEVQTGEIDD